MENTDMYKLKTQVALANILKSIVEQDKTIDDFLQSALEAILDLPWLSFLSKGSIHLTNNDGNIEMVAHKGLGEYLLTNCKLLKPGECLCGKTLQEKKMKYCNHVTHEHDIQPPNMAEHGHYCVPLMYNDEILGVLNLYVLHLHSKQDYEVEFLENVSIVLASMIKKDEMRKLSIIQAKQQSMLNEELLQQNEEIRTINENLEASQKEIKTQAALAYVLKSIVEQEKTIEQFLQSALEAILDLDWLKFLSKGSIHLTNIDGNIEMVAHKGLGDYILTNCKLLKPGECLCGKTLQEKKMKFCNRITLEHDIQPPGMTEHGHYSVPLMYSDEILGVLNLYVPFGHIKQDFEVEFLKSVGIILASTIKKNYLNKLAEKQANEQMMLNEELRQQKEEIVTQNEEIVKQKLEMEHQRDKIVASINYAKKIQRAVLPDKNYSKEVLNEHFILFKPRDIVSGDFFWIKQIHNYSIVVAADCTGHGVPGAFMSMLGTSFLNETVSSKNINNPSKILNILRERVKISLGQKGDSGEQKDGMDLALYIINNETNKLLFSGAYNPLYIIRKGLTEQTKKEFSNTKKIKIIDSLQSNDLKLIELKADRQPIGIYIKEKPFSHITFQLKDGDKIYSFSDGFVDQFGGKKSEKFRTKNFKQLLLSICDKPMEEQKLILEKTFKDWISFPKKNGKKQKQIDDIIIIGMKINNKIEETDAMDMKIGNFNMFMDTIVKEIE